ncbi:MAG: type II secretion system minor pseudopilin GspH [Gammaproteobacteria bacterium]
MRIAYRQPLSRQNGFTLIELMVVSLIIVLITSAIALKLTSGGKKALHEEARRMTALIRLASEQALLEGRDIGLVVEDNGYSFYMFNALSRQWADLGTNKIFRSRTLPDNMRMELAVEENSVTWPDPEERDEDDEEEDSEGDIVIPTPQVLMLSSGEVTPFDLYFEMDKIEPAYQLSIYQDGTRELIELEYGF